MSTKHVISISGGKDSTALLLLAIDRVGKQNVTPIYMDTSNEHQAVYAYLDYLEQALDVKIERLHANFDDEIAAKRRFIARDQRTGRDKNGRKLRWSNKAKRRALAVLHPTGNPYLDLCLWKGRFPSQTGRFCTEELKRNVAVAYQIDLIDAGHRVISWQGIRRGESFSRRNAKKIERVASRLWTFRPLVDWTAEQVFELHRKAGIEPNPLYMQGMKRVGCMPCIHVSKDQIRQIAARFPEPISRIEKWEELVSRAAKRGHSTFFNKINEKGASIDAAIFARNNVRQTIEWARTSRGGRQFDLLADLIEPESCASAYGLCE